MRYWNRLLRSAYSNPVRRRRNRWGPDANSAWIERLEERTLLSCDVMLTREGDLLARGDDGSNEVQIEIVDDVVRVQCNGRQAGEFTGVARIDVQTFGGDDIVSVHGTQTGTFNSDLAFWGELTYQLGEGADHFTADLRSSGLDAHGLGLQVDSGGGGDTLELNIEGSFADLAVAIESGDGNDHVTVRHQINQISAFIDGSTHIHTGGGDDVVHLVFSDIGRDANLKHSRMVVAIDAGDGDDHVSVDVRGTFDAFDLSVDTGGGDDLVSLNLHDVTAASSRLDIRTGDGNDILNFHAANVLMGGGTHDWSWNGSLTSIHTRLSNISVDNAVWSWNTVATAEQVSQNWDVDGMEISNGAQVHWGSNHPGGITVVLMDGSVRGVSVDNASWSWAIEGGAGSDRIGVELTDLTLAGNTALSIAGGEGIDEINVKAHEVLVEGQWLTQIDPGPEKDRNSKPKEIVVVGSKIKEGAALPGLYVRGNDDSDHVELRVAPGLTDGLNSDSRVQQATRRGPTR